MNRLYNIIENANRLYVVIIFIFITSIIALLFSGVIRTVILPPIQYVFWYSRIIYETLPQLFWWTIFLLVLLIIAAWSLIIRRGKKYPGESNNIVRTSRLETWTDTIKKSNQGEYFKWFLAHELSLLSLKIFAAQERITKEETDNLIKSDKLDLPPEIQVYMQTGLDVQKSFRNTRSGLWPFSSGRTSFPEVDTEEMVAFLEEKSGIEHTHTITEEHYG